MNPAILAKAPNWVKITGITLLVLAIFYAMKKLGLIDGVERFDTNGNVQDTAENATPKDGTSVAAIEEEFANAAANYANAQYAAMEGYGTDENALIFPLTNLTGAQLIMVYEAFGVKEGKNLFQWYSSELAGSSWTGLIYSDDNVEGCTSYWDECTELDIMRAIWDKSGLPITF